LLRCMSEKLGTKVISENPIHYYSGIQIFNHLLVKLKELINDQKCFNAALKRFLYTDSFYSLEEYFNYHENSNSNNRF
jgi:hypothetical protein